MGWKEVLADKGITKDNVSKFIISELKVTCSGVRTCESFKIVVVKEGTSGNFRKVVGFSPTRPSGPSWSLSHDVRL